MRYTQCSKGFAKQRLSYLPLADMAQTLGKVKELVGVDELFWRRYFVTYGARFSAHPINCITSQNLVNICVSVFLCFDNWYFFLSLNIQNGTPYGTPNILLFIKHYLSLFSLCFKPGHLLFFYLLNALFRCR